MTQLHVEQIGPMAGQIRYVRVGRFHPTRSQLAHELAGKHSLGPNPDDPQRWG
jgi:hypothetical protein